MAAARDRVRRAARRVRALVVLGLIAPLLMAGASTGAVGAGTVAAATTGTASVKSFFVQVPESPGSTARIPIDVSLYTPAVTPAPAVLLAHGFGQDKTALAPEAKRLQGEGYVVLAYSARGFGRSGGEIALDSLDAEVPDARALVDVLAANPDVEQVKGDPVVGAVGGSYGGALALMLGATDHRIDTVVAAITWNDLADAVDPRSAGTVDGSTATALRDFKSGWMSRLFGAGIAGATTPCGRFTPAFCDLYGRLVSGGQLTASDEALLKRSSPDTVLAGMKAPTLLLQGLQDSLFGLDQSDANAKAIAAAGAPVQVRWFDGGHDGGNFDTTDTVTDDWLAAHLKKDGAVPSTFAYDVPATATSFVQTRTATTYPGLGGTAGATKSVALGGPPQTIVNPPGGEPASVTGIPGLGNSTALGREATGLLGAGNPAGETATFVSAKLTAPTVLAGAAHVQIRVAAAAGTPSEALLYAQLSTRTGDAVLPLPGGVAPIRVPLTPGGTTVDVALPGTAWSFAPGDQLVLALRTSDTQYQGSTAGAAYTVALAGPITLPTVATTATATSAGTAAPGVLIGIVIVLVVAAALIIGAIVVGRRRPAPEPLGQEGPPLAIHGLTKRFRSGFVAVDDVSFTVERGQVLGLLGENGAGKTTTLRMVAGLIRPDAGTVEAFGAPVGPGSPVLSRLGCFIEGPGFLPHLSGRRNLDLYWAATGRPRSEARFAEALAVADLGGAIAKPVRGYSQGMRQRLAIAQAMLGMPDLLVLDEPTNGLDPPQITALRGVLRRYAEGGRTVIVSSHLLAEVEKTCSHVVVMSHGRVVAAGEVAAIAGGEGLESAFLDLIGATEPSA